MAGLDLDADVAVVGAGMAGLYLLHKLRDMGFSVQVLESADDVGGTWYWNRYPGARCDIESLNYSYSFDAELEQEWEWSERYATQPEILGYLQHVAERFDLRKDIRFETKVDRAEWDDENHTWKIFTNDGEVLTCRHYVMATGCLSVPKDIDIAGAETFAGPTYSTGRWPHEGVDFTGRRVAVIGTGSSAIQSIPLIAAQAAELTVFQRTANYSLPAGNRPLEVAEVAEVKQRYPDFREEARWSRGGVTLPVPTESIKAVPEEERERRLEEGWQSGDIQKIMSYFADVAIDLEANEMVCEFFRNKIRAVVDDPETAEKLCPRHFPIFTKRLCLDTNFYETFNLPNVNLVDLRAEPITTITASGIDTSERSVEVDDIVFATGFDAMTGAIVGVDVTGKDGVKLKDAWAAGPQTYLGLTVEGFPNFFTITGPQSPSVLSNMAVSIEQHVEWIAQCLDDMRTQGFTSINPTSTAQDGWAVHNADCAAFTLFSQADSWYMGANVPGKPRVVLPYLGGVGGYREICDDVRAKDYLGFALDGPGSHQCNDGVIAQMQPDVKLILAMMAEMGMPPLETLPVADARGFMDASAEMRPPGPEVGEVLDGAYPGEAGDLAYRLYRPSTPGPHPVILYFHGGGWVLGGATSDDPLCRFMCVAANSIVVSCNYRHAPEAPFPAAVDDGYAALLWLDENREAFGGTSDPLVVAGWSAGANVAAVAAQTARDKSGPSIAHQVLINPVVDHDMSRASYEENAEGYVLTVGLMNWFWDHYCPADQRTDPRASPLRGDLSNLPPAVVFTAQFDPLRDEGQAYVEALRAAGNEAEHRYMRGHVHTSMSAVDMFLSANPDRQVLANALRRGASVFAD